MARKGQTAAFLRNLRRKHGLGEFAAGTKRKTRRKASKRPATRRQRRKRSTGTSGGNFGVGYAI